MKMALSCGSTSLFEKLHLRLAVAVEGGRRHMVERDLLIGLRLAFVQRVNGEIPLGGVRLIHRHAEAQHVRPLLHRRENQPVADLPIVGFFALAFQDAPLDDAVLGDVEADFLVADALAVSLGVTGALGGVIAKDAVQPLDVHRVHNILDGLQPIARRHRVADLAPEIFLDQ